MINLIEKLRADRKQTRIEGLAIDVYERTCDLALGGQEGADSYEFSFPIDLLDAKVAKNILKDVTMRFAEDDVTSTFAWDEEEKILNVKLVATTAPTQQAPSFKFYWSRSPGKFVNKLNGNPVQLASNLSAGPVFTGTVREWYETLVETIIDVGNSMANVYGTRPNKIYVSADVNTILEACILYKPAFSINGTTQHVGTIAGMKVYQDKKQQKNVIQVCLDLDNVRHVGSVEVLDMSII